MNQVVIVLIVYTLGMLAIGSYFYKRNESLGDYFLGDRSLNPYVTALSAQASDMSGWLLLGFPGAVYASGFNAMWIGIGLAIGTYLNWQFTAKRLRRYTEVVDAITISDYLEKRFHDESHALRIISALAIVIFFTIYVSSGLVAGGILFESILGLDYKLAVLLSVIIVGIYTFLGGYKAVCWTDFVQGSLMFLALIITPLVVVGVFNGFGGTIATVGSINPDLLDAGKLVNYNFAEKIMWTSGPQPGDGLTFIGLISLLAWGLGYFGMPHILVRFMGIKSAKDIPVAQFIGVSWVAISLIGAVLVGIIGIAALDPLGNPEIVFLELVKQYLNPWVGGVFLAAVLAAIMSTIDSQLLVSSSALAQDFYKSLIRPEAAESELLWVSRLTVVIITFVGFIFALYGGSVMDIVSYAWAGLGASFGPAILFSLFWQKTSRNGVMAGIITGGVVVVLWKNYLAFTGLYEIIPAFILSALVIYLVSSLGEKPSAQVQAEFATAMRPLVNE